MHMYELISMCVCVYIYIYLARYIYTHTHTHIDIQDIYVQRAAQVHVHIYIDICSNVHILCKGRLISMCRHTHVHTYTCAYIRMCIHTHTYTYIHTHQKFDSEPCDLCKERGCRLAAFTNSSSSTSNSKQDKQVFISKET